ncbi:MAG: DUF1987 domain-containing protein [Campylobacterota bacterium]|nr:DUF1987 domain-containing protein [Campylobacterota bacterium]
MKNLHIEETKYTPQIDLNAETGLLRFSGKSYPENTFDFYQHTMNWITEFFKQERKIKSTLEMDIVYFNSSSSKLFFDLFDIIEEAQEEGNTITIRWLYDGENENALEAGEDFKEDFESLDFNLIEK